MANKPNQKLKLLHVLKALMEKTDDVNGLTTYDILGELAYYGIEAERKGIYRDIEALREFGLDIRQRGGKEWYLATRPFELQEMILLVDALQSTPFLTDELTDRLIERVKAFASDGQKKMLQRRIEVPGRVKMENESVFQNLDVIQQAMRLKRKVEFRYFSYDAKKQRVLRHDGDLYEATPVQLAYADEYYYLIAYSDHHEDFMPYRVDRMLDVAVSDAPATRNAAIANFCLENEESPEFGIFAAEKVPITLEVSVGRNPHIMDPIIDKFGTGVAVFPVREGLVTVHAKAPLSPQFYGWLLQLGDAVRITSPKKAAQEYEHAVRESLRPLFATEEEYEEAIARRRSLLHKSAERLRKDREVAKNEQRFWYLAQTLMGEERKGYRNYVVNAVWQRLGDPGLKPVAHQFRFDGENGYYIDLFFPQLNIGIECDETHHDNEEKYRGEARYGLSLIDIARQIDGKDSDYQGVRVRIDGSLEDAESDINCAVEVIRAKAEALRVAGLFEEWAPEKDVADYFAERQSIRVSDATLFGTYGAVSSVLFGCETTRRTRDVPQSFRAVGWDDKRLWFPLISVDRHKSGKDNLRIAPSGDYIWEKAAGAHAGSTSGAEDDGTSFVVFPHAFDQRFRKGGFCFMGVFRRDGVEDGTIEAEYAGRLRYKRVATSLPLIRATDEGDFYVCGDEGQEGKE